MEIDFKKADNSHQQTIFNWLNEPHVQAHWDNSQAHKDDIVNFIAGRQTPSSYCDGLYTYWLGFIDGAPYCMLMALQEQLEYDIPALKKAHLSRQGHTYSLDYTIGDPAYIGKGLGAKTLSAFVDFMVNEIDRQADTFFIDPAITNPRARRVYEQAGFQYIDDFIMEGDGTFAGTKHHFLVKRVIAQSGANG